MNPIELASADVYHTGGPYLDAGMYSCYGQQGWEEVGEVGCATPIGSQVWGSPPNIFVTLFLQRNLAVG
ncbi:MAG: hypothetical protein ACUVUS_05230 [Thermoproteota archaeon]